MIAVELPTLRPATWLGVTIEAAPLAGSTVFVATLRTARQPTRRRWFPDEASCLAYGAQTADAHGLPLFDLRDGSDDGTGG